ncbi:MAG: hypothetical protein JSU90_01995 [Nitrospiraceae bacterium]|nr:MAG: hypothetical protein JSU90_01995 [Nitrospiraceae bacterium]
MKNLKRGICFFLLLCLAMAGCAVTEKAPESETVPLLEPAPVPSAGPEEAAVSEEGLLASLLSDAVLLESPDATSAQVKRIPAFSRVLITGYEERTFDEAYFRVVYRDERGYLSTNYFTMDRTLKAFIETERENIYGHNLEVIDRIRRHQEDLERVKAWVRPFISDVRTWPSADAQVLDSLDRGSMVFVQEERDDWCRVLYHGPFPDYGDLSYENLDGIVKAYEDPRDLAAAYREGWIEKDLLSEWELERLTDDEKRRSLYIEENPDLFPLIKEAIMNGEIMIGMSREMVAASWGTADEIERSTSLFDDREKWVYGDTSLYFEKGILNAWESFDE